MADEDGEWLSANGHSSFYWTLNDNSFRTGSLFGDVYAPQKLAMMSKLEATQLVDLQANWTYPPMPPIAPPSPPPPHAAIAAASHTAAIAAATTTAAHTAAAHAAASAAAAIAAATLLSTRPPRGESKRWLWPRHASDAPCGVCDAVVCEEGDYGGRAPAAAQDASTSSADKEKTTTDVEQVEAVAPTAKALTPPIGVKTRRPGRRGKLKGGNKARFAQLTAKGSEEAAMEEEAVEMEEEEEEEVVEEAVEASNGDAEEATADRREGAVERWRSECNRSELTMNSSNL